jgi:hypothetical protein
MSYYFRKTGDRQLFRNLGLKTPRIPRIPRILGFVNSRNVDRWRRRQIFMAECFVPWANHVTWGRIRFTAHILRGRLAILKGPAGSGWHRLWRSRIEKGIQN